MKEFNSVRNVYGMMAGSVIPGGHRFRSQFDLIFLYYNLLIVLGRILMDFVVFELCQFLSGLPKHFIPYEH